MGVVGVGVQRDSVEGLALMKSVPVVASYDSSIGDFDIRPNSFSSFGMILDNETNRCFNVIHYSSVTTPNSLVEFDGRLFSVNEIIYESDLRRVLDFHNLDIGKLLGSLGVFSDDVFAEWNSLADRYRDLLDWQGELNEISDGYRNTNRGDFLLIADLSMSLVRELLDKIEKEWMGRYFSHALSSVDDLSMKDGVRYFMWNSKNVSADPLMWDVMGYLGLFRDSKREKELFGTKDARVIATTCNRSSRDYIPATCNR